MAVCDHCGLDHDAASGGMSNEELIRLTWGMWTESDPFVPAILAKMKDAETTKLDLITEVFPVLLRRMDRVRKEQTNISYGYLAATLALTLLLVVIRGGDDREVHETTNALLHAHLHALLEQGSLPTDGKVPAGWKPFANQLAGK